VLGGVFLGQSIDRIQYSWGDGVADGGAISYPARGVRLWHSESGRVVTGIEVTDSRYTYEGIRVGKRIPLGRCVRIAGADKLNFPGPCQYRFRDFWYFVRVKAWSRAERDVVAELATDRGAVTTISIWACKPCVINARTVVLD
jgi:hypothetical protein